MSTQERHQLWKELRGQLARARHAVRAAAMFAGELGEGDLHRELGDMKDQISLWHSQADDAVAVAKGAAEVERR